MAEALPKMILSRRQAGLAAAAAALPGQSRGSPINPTALSYAQAHLVEGARRILYISGQVPTDEAGAAPPTFDDQCRMAWRNVETQLHAAGMSMTNLAKVTIFLAERRHRGANTKIRHEVLKGHAPALTVVIAELFDEAWLLEIEAIAAA
jgi:2-iminobutanoate/2-iminopropanoate deaminase